MLVLLAEDKVRMANVLGRALRREGHVVTLAFDGEETLQIALSETLDIIILDVMLPKLDGFTVMRRLRAARRSTPTIMLTARDAMHDIVTGLDAGADDYLTKPFSLEVLLARIRALGRRVPTAPAPSLLQYADLVLDRSTREVRRGARLLTLTPTEFLLLETLLQRAGRVVPREALVSGGWGPDNDVSENTLYVFIRNLRDKLDMPGDRPLLQTARGIGYLLRGA